MEWAREAERPLNVYATGLLARAMSNQEVAASYREQNSQLVGPAADFLLLLADFLFLSASAPSSHLQVPIMIRRLHQLQADKAKNHQEHTTEEHQQEQHQEEEVLSDSCLWPLSLVMEQRLLLQYVTPLGDYQEVRAPPAGPQGNLWIQACSWSPEQERNQPSWW